MTARPGRCWYCGQAKLADDDPPEHVISSALGAELTSDKVCRECNSNAGRLIDKPLLDDWFVGWQRVLWDIRDVRRAQDRRPPIPDEDLTLPDGAKVRVLHGGTFEVIPRVERSDSEITVSAGSDAEAARILRTIEDRARRDGIALTQQSVRRQLTQEVAGRFVVDPRVWLRATTKMAVAAASLVLPESWLETAQAARYREFMWADAPMTFDGQHPAEAFPQAASAMMTQLAAPPNHLLAIAPSPGRVFIATQLFGSLLAGSVEFEVTGALPRNAWVLDPIGRTVQETTLEELCTEAALRNVANSTPSS